MLLIGPGHSLASRISAFVNVPEAKFPSTSTPPGPLGVSVSLNRKATTGPLYVDQSEIFIPLYSFDGVPNEVEYTKREGMIKVGELSVQLPGRGLDRKAEISYQMGGTEIKVDAKDLSTGKSVTTSFDFLHH